MTVYYVGAGGNDAHDGLSWAARKLTLNGAEDVPLAAGDTVYVGAGTYREQLIVDVSGAAGSPITYIGDYAGSHTDGVGGVVRITGSDDDITAVRQYCVYQDSKEYRIFQGFQMDVVTSYMIRLNSSSNTLIKQTYFGNSNNHAVYVVSSENVSIAQCYLQTSQVNYAAAVYFYHAAGQSDSGHVVENCIFIGQYMGVRLQTVGGVTVRNCTFVGNGNAVSVRGALPAGQTTTVNNCLLISCSTALHALSLGELTEDYNCLQGNLADRSNVAVGAHSNGYMPQFESRWFFESVK